MDVPDANHVKGQEGWDFPLNLQKAVAVMAMADPKDGVNDSPLN
jgi:hypothetical protein